MDSSQKTITDDERFEKIKRLIEKKENEKKMIKMLLLAEFIGVVIQVMLNFRGSLSLILWILMDLAAVIGAGAWIYSTIYCYRQGRLYWDEDLNSMFDDLPAIFYPGVRLMNEYASGGFRWAEIVSCITMGALIFFCGRDLFYCVLKIISLYS